MRKFLLLVAGVLAWTVGVLAQDAASSGSSAASVAATLAAPRVDTSIRTALSADGKSLRYGLDREVRNPPGHPLVSGQVFVASHDVKVTFYKLNPLALDVSADVSDAPDPSHGIVSSLIQAIAGIPGIVAPPPAGGAPKLIEEAAGACTAEDAARELVQKLDRALYGEVTSARTLEAEIEAWRDAITAGFSSGGVSAITAGITRIRTYQDRLDPLVTTAKAQLALADKFAAEVPGTDCEKRAATIYQLVQLISPHARLEQIRKLQKAVVDLQTTLRTVYAVDQKWINNSLEFVVKEDITPTSETMRLVVVKASPVSYAAGDASIEIKRGDIVTASFIVRKYSRYVPEVGVGATFTYFERPKYVTTTVDGKMVVVRAQDDKVNLDPTVLVNLLPQGEEGPAVRMWQLGASSSKESPAIFVGAGWRLFGPGTGGVAIGAGVSIGWVKTLQGLDEGATITGTKDIEDHLKFDLNPRLRPYVNVQYKF